MKSNMMYRVGVGLVFVVLTSAGFAVDAQAQAAGGCFTGPAKMSDADVASFTGAPGAFLTTNPVGSLPMTTQVRALAGSSATALDGLMSLVSQTNPSQKASIGAGLGRAAKSCQAASPDYTQLIQQKVAAANDKDLTAAFLAEMSDVQTAALGAGGNGGGGGAAGIAGGGAAGDGGAAGGDSSTPTTSGTFSIGTRAAFTRTVSQTTIISSPGT